ncbi:zinc finger protein 346 isoform X2 [Podarcis muralis]
MADEADSNGDASALPVGKEAVDRMIKENSHIFTDAHCKVCSAVLISESQKLAHYQSKKHANKVRRYMAIHGEEEVCSSKKIKLDTKQEGSSEEDRNKCCPICNMTFSSPVVANSHYLGKTHAKNLKLKQQPPKAEGAVPAQKQPANPPPTTVPSNEENQNTSDPDKFCSLCHATFNNPLMAKQHYVGKKHKKQETKLKLMAHYGRSPDEPAASTAGKGYPCESCNIVLNSIEQYQAHISGFKHKNHQSTMESPQNMKTHRVWHQRNLITFSVWHTLSTWVMLYPDGGIGLTKSVQARGCTQLAGETLFAKCMAFYMTNKF